MDARIEPGCHHAAASRVDASYSLCVDQSSAYEFPRLIYYIFNFFHHIIW